MKSWTEPKRPGESPASILRRHNLELLASQVEAAIEALEAYHAKSEEEDRAFALYMEARREPLGTSSEGKSVRSCAATCANLRRSVDAMSTSPEVTAAYSLASSLDRAGYEEAFLEGDRLEAFAITFPRILERIRAELKELS